MSATHSWRAAGLRRANSRRMPVALLSMALCAQPLELLAQPSTDTMSATVRIICDLPNGKTMYATGFVWPDASHVVTALHAVAGCRARTVSSEADKVPATAVLASVLLESDLALLKLSKPFRVAPARVATRPVNPGGRFDIVGYPHGVDMAKADPVTFSTGMQGTVVTLDAAYGALKEMREMFSSPDQPYPSRRASIMRVGSTLQPGHSGAPIFDSEGRVVAVADGGLFNGFAGMNWSVPVDVYLPRLRGSTDPHPTQPSRWALMFSATAVEPSAPVAVPAEAARPREGELGAGAFRRVRRMPMALFDEMLRRKYNNPNPGNLEDLRRMLSPQDYATLAFDIYEDAMTGATVGVPAQTRLTWNADLRTLQALGPDGGVRMTVSVLTGRSHEDAKQLGRQALLGSLRHLSLRELSPQGAVVQENPPSGSFAGFALSNRFYEGNDPATGRPLSLGVWMQAQGTHFMGFSVLSPGGIPVKVLSPRDVIAFTMMELAQELNAFAIR